MSTKEKPEFLERRSDERRSVRGFCEVVSGNGAWPAHIINVSTGGALVAVVDENGLQQEDKITLHVELPSGSNVYFNGTIVHLKEHFVGVAFGPDNELLPNKLQELIDHADSS